MRLRALLNASVRNVGKVAFPLAGRGWCRENPNIANPISKGAQKPQKTAKNDVGVLP
jgi:hypothetical protein